MNSDKNYKKFTDLQNNNNNKYKNRQQQQKQ